MSKLYVFSTLASDVAYTNHIQGGADLPVPLPPVVIKGGAGVTNDRIVTPRGVVTEVTEEQVAYLRENDIFKLHEKNGFVMVADKYADPDAAAADMTGRDNSAPVVPQDNIAGDAETIVGGVAVDPAAQPAARSKSKK